jgi:hypothetical protein
LFSVDAEKVFISGVDLPYDERDGLPIFSIGKTPKFGMRKFFHLVAIFFDDA